jgi:colicin import membrane protein
MSRRDSLEERARAEVERIKAEEAAEQERKQERMRELAEQARERREVEAEKERGRKAEREAKLRRVQAEGAKAEERRAKESARRQWRASGGTEVAFERCVAVDVGGDAKATHYGRRAAGARGPAGVGRQPDLERVEANPLPTGVYEARGWACRYPTSRSSGD